MKSIKYHSDTLNCEIEIDYVINSKFKIEDAFYFLDGQNAFLDKNATYGRSLRALDHLDKLKKGYIAIGIHSPKEDKERLNMYSPFIITKGYLKDYENKPKVCHQFINELEHIVVSHIQSKYNIKKHHLIASSLAASLAIYINSISKLFTTMCILSNSNFIFEEEMYKHLNSHKSSNSKLFIGVGTQEFSDNIYSKELYLKAYNDYLSYLKSINASYYQHKLLYGKHNEASWEKQFKIYLKKVIA